MSRRRLFAVLAIVLLSAAAVVPILAGTQGTGGSQQAIRVYSNDVCALGTECYPHPLIVQVVDPYAIQVPSPHDSSVRFAVQVDSGSVQVRWQQDGGGVVGWSAAAGQQSLVDETVPVISGTNYALTVENTSDSASLVEISIWYVT